MEKSQLSDLEQLREQNIQRNNLFLNQLGNNTSQKPKEKSVVVAKKRIIVEPQRRSYRQRTSQAKKDNEEDNVCKNCGKVVVIPRDCNPNNVWGGHNSHGCRVNSQ